MAAAAGTGKCVSCIDALGQNTSRPLTWTWPPAQDGFLPPPLYVDAKYPSNAALATYNAMGEGVSTPAVVGAGAPPCCIGELCLSSRLMNRLEMIQYSATVSCCNLKNGSLFPFFVYSC